MRNSLGVMMVAKINLISQDANDGEGQQGTLEVDFGVNNVPSFEEVDAEVVKAISMFNETFGVSDTRLVTMGDYGYAHPRSLDWGNKA